MTTVAPIQKLPTEIRSIIWQYACTFAVPICPQANLISQLNDLDGTNNFNTTIEADGTPVGHRNCRIKFIVEWPERSIQFPKGVYREGTVTLKELAHVALKATCRLFWDDLVHRPIFHIYAADMAAPKYNVFDFYSWEEALWYVAALGIRRRAALRHIRIIGTERPICRNMSAALSTLKLLSASRPSIKPSVDDDLAQDIHDSYSHDDPYNEEEEEDYGEEEEEKGPTEMLYRPPLNLQVQRPGCTPPLTLELVLSSTWTGQQATATSMPTTRRRYWYEEWQLNMFTAPLGMEVRRLMCKNISMDLAIWTNRFNIRYGDMPLIVPMCVANVYSFIDHMQKTIERDGEVVTEQVEMFMHLLQPTQQMYAAQQIRETAASLPESPRSSFEMSDNEGYDAGDEIESEVLPGKRHTYKQQACHSVVKPPYSPFDLYTRLAYPFVSQADVDNEVSEAELLKALAIAHSSRVQ